MGVPDRHSEPYTYADYLSWSDGERWELIEGVPYSMSPAPGREHQQILLDLARLIAAITDEGTCETYIAPFDVALYERHGVREYWLVNADAAYVMVYRLEPDGGFAKPDYYRREEKVRSDVLGGAEIPVAGFVRKGHHTG